jgi:hypothetical protein
MGDCVDFRALELKHNLHPDAMRVPRKGGVLCAVERLHALLAHAALSGRPITGYLCRPLNPSRTGFLEASLSVSAFEEDVAAHFTASGIPYHATLHGSRRGSLQHHADRGTPLEQLARLAQIKTPAVLQRYLDPFRHQPPPLSNNRFTGKRSRVDPSASGFP